MPRDVFQLVFALAALIGISGATVHAKTRELISLDSDRDGLSDELEAALLDRFLPTFMISQTDCSVRPARFVPDQQVPTVLDDDGTIYGQASPRIGHPGQVELHYYHLWRKDCGEMGHRLDTEHVSALIELGTHVGDAKATYWYAAAHEDTLCDASQVTRAETVHAQDHGATIWISEGKHASFLSGLLCTHGCGGDRCDRMGPLLTKQVINLGEPGAPMDQIAWLASAEWPLAEKMRRTDFPAARVARLSKLPDTDIGWASPSKRPAQAVVLGTNSGLGGAATGARATDTALVVAHDSAASALNLSAEKTGVAIRTSFRDVWHAIRKTF